MGGRTGFGRGAAASEPPRPRRPSPRLQRLTRRGRGDRPSSGGRGRDPVDPREKRARVLGQGEPKNREPRSGDSRARRELRDRTGLEINWLWGPASRDQKAVRADDPKGSGAGGGVHGNPQGPGAPERRICGAGAGIQPESSGRGRDLVDPEGGREREIQSQKRAGAESGASRLRSAPLLGRKARAGGGLGERSAARRPGLLALCARARPPRVHPSSRVMIRRRSSRSSPARHRAAASPAPCRESGAHPSLAPACPPALRSVRD